MRLSTRRCQADARATALLYTLGLVCRRSSGPLQPPKASVIDIALATWLKPRIPQTPVHPAPWRWGSACDLCRVDPRAG